VNEKVIVKLGWNVDLDSRKVFIMKTRRVTIEMVAAEANVSVNAVSRALSGKDGVGEETRNRIIEIAQKLHYRPNILAKSMRQNNSGFIGVLVLDIGNSVFTKMIKGIENELQKNSLSIIIGNSDENEEKEHHYLETMLSTQCSGIIISHVSNSGLKLLRQEGVPFVVLDRDTENFDCDLVYVDNCHMGYTATKHLIGLGHRNIAFIGKESFFDTDQKRRAEGFKKALQEMSADKPERIYLCRDANQGSQTFHDLWNQSSRPTALVIGQHSIAEGVVFMINQMNIKIPQELSVVIIGEPRWATIFSPNFTTIERPLELIGVKAAELLMEKIKGESSGPYTNLVIPSDLVIRESTAALRR
jgi:DNA-binding LacI/PurR family transcriptional regulator